MSEVLTVPTAFGDISDLTEGLVDRVDGEQIILYGPTPYEEGAEIDFSVLLLDGTPALEGRGRVEASVDGGEERDPSTRFDIILGGLELGGVAEAVFERMLMARASMLSGGEAEYAEEAPADQPLAEPEAPEGDLEAEAPEAEVEGEPAFDEPAAEAEALDEPEPAAEEPAEAYGEEAPAAEEPAVEEPAEAYGEEAPAAEEPAVEPASFGEDEEPAAEEPALGDEPEAAADDAWGSDEGAFDDEATVVSDGAYAADEAEVDDAGAEEAPAEEPAAPVAAAIAIPTELFPADDAFRGAAPPAAPSDPGGFGVTRDLTEGLIRPVQQNTWTPVAPPRPEPRPSTGLFEYGASIPLPEAPPRPELDPSMIVTRAPHPGAVEASVEDESPAASEDAYAGVADEADEVVYEDDSVAEEASAEPAAESGEYEAVAEEASEEPVEEELELELEASERD